MLVRLCRLPVPASSVVALIVLLAMVPLGTVAHAQETSPLADSTVTYEEAVQLALDRNYRVRLAKNDVTSQSISVSQNRMEYLPSVSAGVNGNQSYGESFSSFQGQLVNNARSANFGVDAQVNLFDGFNKDATLDQAQAQARGASRTLRRRRQDVVFDVLSRYIDLAQNRALVEVREEQLALREQQLEQTQAQIEVGERAPSEVYQFQADVAAAEQQLLQAERNVEIVQTELVRLLVLDPFGSYEFETEALEADPESELAPTSYRLDQLLGNAYDERADLSAQQAAIAAERQGVRAARSGFWPSLSLSANYGSNWSNTSFREVPGTGSPPETVQITPDNSSSPIEITVPGTGADPQLEQTPFFAQLDDERSGGISLSLSYPLFDRLQTHYSVERAQVQLENQRFQEELLRQDIAVEVRQALVDYRNARTELEVTQERLQAAEQAQEAAQERYRLGAATYVELAQANADLAEAQSARVRAQYSLLLQQKRLDYVTGTLDLAAPLAR